VTAGFYSLPFFSLYSVFQKNFSFRERKSQAYWLF